MKNNNKNIKSINRNSYPESRFAKDHRPLRWVVRQWFTEKDQDGEYRAEVITGYNTQIEKVEGMTSALSQAKSNVNRYGGELYAEYGNGVYIPVV